jgi:hypothetical protein
MSERTGFMNAVDEIERLEARVVALEAALAPLEAWATHVLNIVGDHRVPTWESRQDGEAIIKLARAALAPEGEER